MAVNTKKDERAHLFLCLCLLLAAVGRPFVCISVARYLRSHGSPFGGMVIIIFTKHR